MREEQLYLDCEMVACAKAASDKATDRCKGELVLFWKDYNLSWQSTTTAKCSFTGPHKVFAAVDISVSELEWAKATLWKKLDTAPLT